MMGLVKLVFRVFSVVGKEIIEVLRRPGAIFSLILGPFLILAVFGLGYGGYVKPLRAAVVIDGASTLPNDLASYRDLVRGIEIVDVTGDRGAAEARLRAGELDAVVVAPADPLADIEAGRQAEVAVIIDVIDPFAVSYAEFLSENLSTAINREIYRRGAAEGQEYAVTIGGRDMSNISPDVIASPTRAVLTNLSKAAPTVIGFFGPAALALVIQHMAVILIALSIVRERNSGAIDRFRASPMRATEVVLGKVLAFGLLGGAIAGLSVWLLVTFLDVPMVGSPAAVAMVLGLLLIASLGLGLLISVVSDSERQAVQLALLTLLASMFFSGFVLRISEFQPAVQYISYALPVTHGIALLQQVLLTGSISQVWQLVLLGFIGAVLLVTSWLLLRRELRPA
jgi:ABC-2 type transport system permease protein